MKVLFIFGALLISIQTISVSFHHLQAFFNQTYDQNRNGKATLDEFVDYFQFMEPEHNLTREDVKETFDIFDSDSDGNVELSELLQIAKIRLDLIPLKNRQLHIGLTGKDKEMQVIWVSTYENYSLPVVHYGLFPGQLSKKAYAITSSYNVGHFGFHGSIYKAIITDLEPNKRYYYQVGDEHTKAFSYIRYFKSPPLKNTHLEEINIASFGDMGTFAPMGHAVINQISKDNFIKPFDFVFLTGDIAYAGMNGESFGENEPIWDLFGELSESFAAYTPFMPGVGNHERFYNYTAYRARYDLPKIYPGQTNLWFSFDYGQVHMIHFSSEHPYQKGSEQYAFLEEDLKKARANPNTKWIMLGVHRAFYSSDSSEYKEITPLSSALEELVGLYKVDLVLTGHLHCYERSWPTLKGKAIKEGHKENHFYSPTSPIYVVQGSAGALIREKWINPQPEWSIKRLAKYGYGKIRITGNTLRYQFISSFNGKVLDEWFISK